LALCNSAATVCTSVMPTIRRCSRAVRPRTSSATWRCIVNRAERSTEIRTAATRARTCTEVVAPFGPWGRTPAARPAPTLQFIQRPAHMATVYQFEYFDSLLKRMRRSERFATEEAIRRMGGKFVPDPAYDIDDE